jgi:outer membrane protein TolC
LIDQRRLNLNNARIDADIATIDAFMVRLGVQHRALTQYWKWVAAGQVRDVYRELLRIATTRQANLVKRAESGDIADIAVTEGKQQILTRKSQLNEAEQRLALEANKLSLYLRDDAGEPVTPSIDQLPAAFPPPDKRIDRAAALEALSKRPELQQLSQQQRLLRNQRRAGENAFLPKADLDVSMSQDQGSGSSTRDTLETVVKLDVSIPLQQRQARGKVRQAETKLRQLSHQQRLTRDKLTIELRNAFAQLDNAQQFVRITDEAIATAQQMREAEQQLFRTGASSFFLLNMREQSLGESRVNHIRALKRYQVALANLYALTINESALHISAPQ